MSLDGIGAAKAQMRARLDAMHIERQRELVRHFLDVTVEPGRGAKKYVLTHKVVTSLNDEFAA